MNEVPAFDDVFVEAVRAEISILNEMRQIMLEQHSHAFKWLNASLLAINGGASVAVLNSTVITPLWKVICGLLFAVGIIFALLIAVLAQKAHIRALPHVQRQIGYWLSVMQGGERLTELEKTMNYEMKEAQKFDWIVPGVGWLSAVMFGAGLCTLGYGLIHVQENIENAQGYSVVSPKIQTS